MFPLLSILSSLLQCSAMQSNPKQGIKGHSAPQSCRWSRTHCHCFPYVPSHGGLTGPRPEEEAEWKLNEEASPTPQVYEVAKLICSSSLWF